MYKLNANERAAFNAGLYTVIIRNNDGVVMRSSKVIVISN